MYICADYGTSFSQAATVHNGFPTVLLPRGVYGIHSEFYYDSRVGEKVGEEALEEAKGINFKNLISESKMKINLFPLTVNGKSFEFEHVAGSIYSLLKTAAVDVAKKKLIKNPYVEGVVITAPVGFEHNEKKYIKAAAASAFGGNDKIMYIIKEPVAAAIGYYKNTLENNKNILVFDLGGGTCDVALVRANNGAEELFDVIDNEMERVGGRDWDGALAEYIANCVSEAYGVDASTELYAERIKTAATEVKQKLSDPSRSIVEAKIALADGRIARVPVTLKVFEELTTPLLDRALKCLECVYDRNNALYPIYEIICVGGSSNMLQVKRGIETKFPNVTVRLYEPETAVVCGGAVFADMIKGKTIPQASVKLKDIACYSYGIRVFENYKKDPHKKVILNIIRKGDKLPITSGNSFCPTKDNQDSVLFEVFESDYDTAEYDESLNKRSIGALAFMLPPNTTSDYSINVDMTMNGDGLLYFKATGEEGESLPYTFDLNK